MHRSYTQGLQVKVELRHDARQKALERKSAEDKRLVRPGQERRMKAIGTAGKEIGKVKRGNWQMEEYNRQGRKGKVK